MCTENSSDGKRPLAKLLLPAVMRPSAFLARSVRAPPVLLDLSDLLDLYRAFAQADVRQLRAEVAGLRLAARSGPTTAGNLVKIMNRSSARQENTFNQQLAELKGALDSALDEKLKSVLDEQKRALEPVLKEQRRFANTLDAVTRFFQLAAGVFTLGVAIWGAFIQAHGSSILPPMHPTVRFGLRTVFVISVFLICLMAAVAVFKWLSARVFSSV